jgi:ketosteroid isomerase-like protein
VYGRRETDQEAQMATDDTLAVVRHHAEVLGAGDLDAIMSDYADNAVFISDTSGAIVGAAAIRAYLSTPSELSGIEPTALHVEGDYLYVRWTADGVRLGTDTFVVSDGKIVLQTVTIDRS